MFMLLVQVSHQIKENVTLSAKTSLMILQHKAGFHINAFLEKGCIRFNSTGRAALFHPYGSIYYCQFERVGISIGYFPTRKQNRKVNKLCFPTLSNPFRCAGKTGPHLERPPGVQDVFSGGPGRVSAAPTANELSCPSFKGQSQHPGQKHAQEDDQEGDR